VQWPVFGKILLKGGWSKSKNRSTCFKEYFLNASINILKVFMILLQVASQNTLG